MGNGNETFTAADARELTIEAIKNRQVETQKEINDILDQIKEACMDGKNELIYYCKPLSNEIKSKLLELGFDVEEFSTGYNEISTSIVWGL